MTDVLRFFKKVLVARNSNLKKLSIACIAMTCFLHVPDLLSTWIALTYNLREGNFIMRYGFNTLGFYLTSLISFIALFYYAAVFIYKISNKNNQLAAVVIFNLYSFVVLFNCIVVIKCVLLP